MSGRMRLCMHSEQSEPFSVVFCIPGMVMAGTALLQNNLNPTEEDVKIRAARKYLPLYRIQENY